MSFFFLPLSLSHSVSLCCSISIIYLVQIACETIRSFESGDESIVNGRRKKQVVAVADSILSVANHPKQRWPHKCACIWWMRTKSNLKHKTTEDIINRRLKVYGICAQRSSHGIQCKQLCVTCLHFVAAVDVYDAFMAMTLLLITTKNKELSHNLQRRNRIMYKSMGWTFSPFVEPLFFLYFWVDRSQLSAHFFLCFN